MKEVHYSMAKLSNIARILESDATQTCSGLSLKPWPSVLFVSLYCLGKENRQLQSSPAHSMAVLVRQGFAAS